MTSCVFITLLCNNYFPKLLLLIKIQICCFTASHPVLQWSAAVLLKAVRTEQPGAVWTPPGADRNSTVERSERNKSHTNNMLTTCSVPSFYHVQDKKNEKNNVILRYAQTYTTVNCKKQHRIAKTDPDSVRKVPGRPPDGSGRRPDGFQQDPSAVRPAVVCGFQTYPYISLVFLDDVVEVQLLRHSCGFLTQNGMLGLLQRSQITLLSFTFLLMSPHSHFTITSVKKSATTSAFYTL